MKKLIPLAAAVAAATALAVVPAQATFNGANGLLVYQAKVGDHVQLFTIRPDGSGARQVTHFTDSDGTNAAWSPNSKTISLVRQWGPNKARLYTMNADGTGLHALNPSLRGSNGWFPDGKHVLVVSSLRWTIVTARGTQPRYANIPGSGDWPCILPDGKRAVFIASAGRSDGKSAVFVAEIGGGRGSLKRITPWQKLGDKVELLARRHPSRLQHGLRAAEVRERLHGRSRRHRPAPGHPFDRRHHQQRPRLLVAGRKEARHRLEQDRDVRDLLDERRRHEPDADHARPRSPHRELGVAPVRTGKNRRAGMQNVLESRGGPSREFSQTLPRSSVVS